MMNKVIKRIDFVRDESQPPTFPLLRAAPACHGRLFSVGSGRLGVVGFLTLCILHSPLSTAFAQTNAPAPAPTPQSFLTSAESYVTGFNTNLDTFSTNCPLELWTGGAYQSGLNLGAQVGLEAKPFSQWPGLTLGSVSTMAGIGGTFASQEADAGYSIVHYDVEFSAGLGGVYDFQTSGARGAVYAEIKKALTQNTFAGLRLEGLFGGSTSSQPVVSIFAGFTF
jgi:hypothetical protein